MKRGKDVPLTGAGVYIVHHNCPGLKRDSLTFNEHLLFIPLQGEIQIQLSQKKFSIGTGKMLYLPPKSTHSFVSSRHQGERLIALIKDKNWNDRLSNRYEASILPLSHLVKELIFYLLLNPKTKYHTSIAGVLIETLDEHLAISGTSGQIVPMEHIESKVKDFRVMAALQFMRSNFHEDLSV